MITVTFGRKEDKTVNNFELICHADGGSPFVFSASDVFQNIASPADMMLLSDTPDGVHYYRSADLSLIFRAESTMDYTEENIQKQLDELNQIELSDLSGETLFSNIP